MLRVTLVEEGGVRIVVQEARVLDLTWNEEKRHYVFRLLHGSKFVTPKLPLTPLHVLQLMQRQTVNLDGWVKMHTDRQDLVITHVHGYERWPVVLWPLFTGLARQVRPGKNPEEDWEHWREKRAETEREKYQ